jgi:hypothetical protein
MASVILTYYKQLKVYIISNGKSNYFIKNYKKLMFLQKCINDIPL